MKSIYDLLKEDHKEVKDMLASLEERIDHNLLKKVDKTLTFHTEAEERAFYKPLQKRLGALSVIIKAANQEHEIVSYLLKQASIFSLAKKHLTNKETEEMAGHFKEEKSKL